MLFSQYAVCNSIPDPESMVKIMYRALKGSREAREAHDGNRPSPFAVKLVNGRYYVSVWGDPEELLALRAKRHYLQPRIMIPLDSLHKLTPKGDAVTVRHVSPTAFRSYGRTVPEFVKELYFLRPARVLAEAGVELKPKWEKVFVNTKSRLWKIRGSIIRGFSGEVTFYGVNDDLKLLLAAAEFTGLGYKTGWGMGSIKVVEGVAA